MVVKSGWGISGKILRDDREKYHGFETYRYTEGLPCISILQRGKFRETVKVLTHAYLIRGVSTYCTGEYLLLQLL